MTTAFTITSLTPQQKAVSYVTQGRVKSWDGLRDYFWYDMMNKYDAYERAIVFAQITICPSSYL